MECLPIQSHIYIPENKVSAWVSKKEDGNVITKDKSKEYQGVWVVEGYSIDKKKSSTEVWIFRDDDVLGIDRRVLENNPLQGTWGYAPNVRNVRKAEPHDIWFFPPKSAKCKIPVGMQEYIHKGIWIKPTFKRNFSQLESNSTGFMTVSGNMKIAKGERHSIAGKWNMLGFNDDVVRGKKKKKDDDDGSKGPYEIFVRKPSGVRFPIKDVIPGNRISLIKKKIYKEHGIPIEEQRLSFNDVPLKDEKTVVGSGIRNGNTIDLGEMIIYVRNLKGEKYTFKVDPDELVENVKKMIEIREGTPVSEQQLYFNETKLDDDGKPILHFNIKHKSILHLDEEPEPPSPKDKRKPLKEKTKSPNRKSTTQKAKYKPDPKVSNPPTLELPPEPESFEVKTPDGRSFFFDFDPNKDTIDSLKKKIAKTVQLPVKDLHLTDDNDEIVDPNSAPLRGAVFDVAPQIEVVLPHTTKKIILSVLPKMTVEDLKDVIEEKTGTPKAKQRIFFFDSEGNELDDSASIKKTGIGQGSVLEVRPEPESFEVKTPDGRSFFFDFDPNKDTFNSLEKKIAKTIQLPVKDLRLTDSNDDLVDLDNIKPVRGAIFDVAPQIEVSLPHTTKKIRLSVLPKMTVEDLKDVVEEKTGTPKAKQRIFFLDSEGNELDDSTPMKKTGIGQGSVLEVRPLESKPKEITIKDSTGRIFKFFIDSDEPIKKLKKRIAKKIGIPLGGFTLNDKDWDDDDEIGSDDAGLVRAARNGGVLVLDVPEVENAPTNSEKIDLNILPIRDVKNVENEIDQPMSICVNVPSRKKPVRFAVDPSDTIRKIKRRALKKIKKNKGESARDYCLVIGGRELDDGETLERCKIQHDALLSLEEFKLRIMHWSGKIIDLDGVTRHNTVASLKKQICRTEGIPLNEQRLSLYGRRLEDKETMEEVKHKTILVLEPLDADIDVTEAGKTSAKKMKIKRFKSGDYNEIWPVMPDWKRRIFFFDNDDKFDAHIDLFCCIGSTGEKILLDNIHPNTKVAEIKSKICALKGIKKKKHTLKFDGTLLDGRKTLREQSVRHRSILVFESPAVFIAAPTLEKLNGIFEMLPTRIVHNINITVKHWNGDTFTLHPAPNDYIDDVKDAICKITNIPNEQLRLLFQGRLTCDDMNNLMEQNIVEGSVLELEPMRILLELPTKTKLVSINVELDQTLYDVKKVIVKMTKIALDSLCIMFGGVELDYTKTLSDYGIEHEDTLRIETFEIKILQWSGEMFTLNSVGPNDTTYELKNKIADSKSFPPRQQIISLKGQILNDVLRLKDQGIKHRSVLMLNQQKGKRTLPVIEKVSLFLFKSGTDGGKEGNDTSSTLSFDDLSSESSHQSLTNKRATTHDSKVAKKKKSDRDNGGSGKGTKSSSSRSKERESSKEKKKKKDKTVRTEKPSKKKKQRAKDNGSPGTVTSKKKKKAAKYIESPGTVTSKKKKRKPTKDTGSPLR